MKLLEYHKQNYLPLVKKSCLFILLLAIGLLFGIMREMQAQAINEGYSTNYFAIIFFVIAGTSVPIVVSALKKWVGNKISEMRTWEEKETQVSRQMGNVSMEIAEVTQKRIKAEQNLEKTINHFGGYYEKALADNRKKELTWKAFDAKLQSDMSIYTEAYRKMQNKGTAMQLIPKLKYLAFPLIMLLLIMLVCSSGAFASDWFMLCDRSTSSLNICNKEVIKDAFVVWLQATSTGDKFEVFIIGGDIYDAKLAYTVTVPKFSSPVTKSKTQWKRTISKEIDSIELPNTGKSAIFQTLWRISQKITNKNSALVLISDLRHVDKRYNFEKKVPGSKEFIKYLKEQGIGHMNLTGHRVYVCGFHPNASVNTSVPTANTLIQTKSLWEEVFKSWNIKVLIQEECRFDNL